MKLISKTIITMVSVILASSMAWAQTDAELSAMAKDLLDKMAAKNKSYKTIKATFTVTVDNKQAKTKADHDGTLSLKGDMYVLDILNAVTYFDGNTVCTWLREENEANISGIEDAGEAAIGPMQILGSFDKGYKMRYIDNAAVDGVPCAEVDLYPIDVKHNSISRVRLTIDRNSCTIKRIMQQGKDGTSYYVTIKSFDTNVDIPDSYFTFDASAHPGVEVVDLR